MNDTLAGTRPMMVNLSEATAYLYRLPRGSKSAGLARARKFFTRLGDPQNAVRTVHVAGTAGKGSVCAFVASILGAHGFRVGTHLSPHVRSILERVQIDAGAVADDEFVAAVNHVASAAETLSDTPLGTPTFFEAANAVAFTRFAAAAVDYAVIETGIGGLLDATNTITRSDKLAVVGRIGIDHTSLLGETVAEIARHKAGILPTNGHGVVLRHHQARVRAEIAETARARRCRLDVVDPREVRTSVGIRGTVLHLPGADFPLGLQGEHQGINASLALRCAQHLASRDGWTLGAESVRRGLENTWLPGRFERHVVNGRDVILDGAHNNVKLVALVDTFRALYPERRATWVLAAKADKDLQSVLASIAPVAAGVVATQLPQDADGPVAPSISASQVAEFSRSAGLHAIAIDDPAAAVRAALDWNTDTPIVVTGSFLHLAAADPLFRKAT
jgi:dihydrofolate synthase/folylpolyglutamate synthase